MKEKTCKDCKREFSKDARVIVQFCGKCSRALFPGGNTDYYERKVNKI